MNMTEIDKEKTLRAEIKTVKNMDDGYREESDRKSRRISWSQ